MDLKLNKLMTMCCQHYPPSDKKIYFLRTVYPKGTKFDSFFMYYKLRVPLTPKTHKRILTLIREISDDLPKDEHYKRYYIDMFKITFSRIKC